MLEVREDPIECREHETQLLRREFARLGLAPADADIHHRAQRIRDRFGKLCYASFEKVA